MALAHTPALVNAWKVFLSGGITVDLAGDEPHLTHTQLPIRSVDAAATTDPEHTRKVIESSVRVHLRADVPACCLLSGGLDSSIIAAIAADVLPDDHLHTFCAGAPDDDPDSDFSFARTAAEHIGCAHTETPVTAALFARRWADMVRRQGVPLSTPNEVAINEVARVMRANGRVVTLSGEGADELFAGYELPIRLAAAHVEAGNEEPGLFQLHSNAWIPVIAKPNALNPAAWRAIEHDDALLDFYREEFTAAATETDDPLDAHLRFHRRVNLSGLLLRLDSATMLESIEGRTPYADRDVAAFAQSLALNDRYRGDPCETKRPLRRAFADRLPQTIVERPKASFPLPFQDWMHEHAGALRTSDLIDELFAQETIETTVANPSLNWAFAWPMINLALWSQRWWGA
ncbi:MAG: asparagine synthase [Planctomycetes bacterium]|nr:asparagine synthase [Planctomycetota bacterium]